MLPYYEDWRDEDYDNFFEPMSETDVIIKELKQTLEKGIKKKFLDEMERLRKENEELQEFKKREEKIEEEAEAIIEKLAKENQGKTRKQELFEKYPNATTAGLYNIPLVCCAELGYCKLCPPDGQDCCMCRNETVE